MMTGRELLDYVMAKNQGAPLARETIHEIARRHKITDKTFDEEEEAIAAEEPSLTEDIDPLTGKPREPEPEDDDTEDDPENPGQKRKKKKAEPPQ
jgi:hypothetical protein